MGNRFAMTRKEECACFLLAGELQRMYIMMSEDSKPPPMRDLTSIDQLHARFTSEDIELTCYKKVEVQITIFHPTDNDGRPIFAENIVSLRFSDKSREHQDDGQEENEQWIDWTTLKPLDFIAGALAITPQEEIWSIAEGSSELERKAIKTYPCPHCSREAVLLTDVEEMEPALDAKGNRQYYCLGCQHTFAVDEHGEVVTTVQ